MDCTNCGACCVDQIIPLNQLERKTTLPEHMDGYGNLKRVNGHCIFFDPKIRQCTNYEHRPTVCRDFDSGCGRCIIMRAFAVAKLGGISEGPVPVPVKPGLFARFAERLHIEEDGSGNVLHLAHPDPDIGMEQALMHANQELPSKGF